MPKEDAVTVVGAGLAGSEAAWQLATAFPCAWWK